MISLFTLRREGRPSATQDSLQAAGPALPDGIAYPHGPDEGFHIFKMILLSRRSWRKDTAHSSGDAKPNSEFKNGRSRKMTAAASLLSFVTCVSSAQARGEPPRFTLFRARIGAPGISYQELVERSGCAKHRPQSCQARVHCLGSPGRFPGSWMKTMPGARAPRSRATVRADRGRGCVRRR